MSKWFLEVVQDFDGSYYANLTVNAMPVKGLPEYVDYNALKKAIKEKTGIEIPNKKDMLFQQNGRKNYAYFDATQEREDGRVTLDEMKQGWRPKFDAVSITVYKDALGYQDDKDNLTEIAVPKEWLKDTLKSFGEEDFGLWRNTYTADDTMDIALKALSEGVILACADENIRIEGPMALDDAIAIAKDVSEGKNTNKTEKEMENLHSENRVGVGGLIRAALEQEAKAIPQEQIDKSFNKVMTKIQNTLRERDSGR